MAGTARKTDEALWDKVKAEITEGDKGGHAGQWSARKAQLASAEYRKRGGGYAGPKDPENHLSQWTHEEWGTKSGHASGETGERYLPKAARDALSEPEYARTTAKKRADSKAGHQFSRQPRNVAAKTAPHREGHAHALAGLTKAELLERARARGIKGRSRMTRDALAAALS